MIVILGSQLSIYTPPFKLYLSSFVCICIFSIILNFKNKLWKKDIVFTIMEPAWHFAPCAYIFFTSFFYTYRITIYWLTIYISLQLVLVIIKLYIIVYTTSIIKDRNERLKLIIVTLPLIKSSFGFNDLNLVLESHIVHSTPLDILQKEIDFMSQRILAITKYDINSLKKINRVYSEFRNKNGIENKDFVSLKPVRKQKRDEIVSETGAEV